MRNNDFQIISLRSSSKFAYFSGGSLENIYENKEKI